MAAHISSPLHSTSLHLSSNAKRKRWVQDLPMLTARS